MSGSKRSGTRITLHALVVFTMLVGLIGPLASIANAAPIVAVDDAGADDEPGQKDLNALSVDYGNPGATTINVKWNWDDTATSGANTRDGGALFDTDGDGFANYSLYVTVATNGTSVTQLYLCSADNRTDRCAGPSLVSTFSSTATVSTVANSDPFGVPSSPDFTASHVTGNQCDAKPGCYTADTVANANIVLSDFGNPSDATLLNVCSYPSGEPNSDPSDCVFAENSGFLTIVKVADPDDGTEFDFSLGAGQASRDGTSSWTITGADSVQLISFAAGTAYDLSEAVPEGWQLDDASCVIQTATPTGTGTETATGVDNFEIKSGLETICTFTDSLSAGSLTLVKVVDNLGETGPDYLGVSDFPLSIDGTATTSGTSVSVSAGNHTIAETSQDGYTVGTWSCDDGTSGTAGEVSATVNISGGEDVTCTMANTLVADPALSLVKTASPTTYDSVGDVIDYSYEVTNTGNVTLAGPVTVTDDKATVDCPAGDLAPGASTTCTASYSITQADLDAGSVKNTAQAHADGTDSNFDDETVTAGQSPLLVIAKVDDGQHYDAVGDVITYTITVENTGNTTLHNVTVTDPNATGLTCTPPNGSTLAPDDVMTCSASHTVTQADIDAGSYLNTACVDDGAGGAAEVCDDVTTPGDKNPHLTISKVATEASFDEVGDVIHYTIVATNDGNTTLSSVTVTDPNASGLTCTPDNGSSLAPGASLNCTASHTVTQADIDAGSYYNQACVDDGAGGATEACDDVTTPAGQSPLLVIAKVDDGQHYDAVGDVITYTITVENTGNTTLHNVTVTDPNATGLTCTPPNGSTLAPDDVMTCSASHTVTQADIDAGSYLNTACVDDGAGGAAEVCDDVTTPGDKNPHLTISKVATEASFDEVGDVIHYTIVATNDGNTTLSSVTVTDPNASGLTCTPDNGSSLAPGASLNCTASHTVTQADIDAGSYYNQACVDDGAGGATEACDDVTTPAGQSPLLVIAKVDDGQHYDAVGDVITYTITVENTGNTTLHNVTVTDPNATGLTCTPPNGSTLAPDDVMTCSASHTVTQADIDAGSYLNTACVDDGAGGAAEVCDDVTTPGDKNPHLTISKVATEASFDEVGDVIHYTIVATNDGNTTLSSVTVTDPNASGLTCTPDNGSSLAPGASLNCTASHTVTQADIDAGSYYNQACVDDGAGGATEACDDVTTPAGQSPALSLTKSASPATYFAAGQVITYSYVITNSGNTTLSGPFTITDDKATVTCTQPGDGKLSPGESMNCTATYTIQAGDLNASSTGSVTNTAVATNGTVTSNQAQATVRQVASTGQIAPTATTCQNFRDGTAGDLTQILYGVKGTKINNVAPGVLFYYSLVTVPAGTTTISVTQTTSPSFTLFGIQQNQAILWSSNCTKVQSNKTGSFTVTNSTETTYIVGIKYSPETVVGQTKPAGNGQVTYTFTTYVDGVAVATSPDSLILKPKN